MSLCASFAMQRATHIKETAMIKLISTVCAAALIGSGAIVPATASPLIPQPSLQVDDSVIDVGHKGKWKKKGEWRHGKRHYRRGNDWWIPGAIIGGAIIGGVLSQPRYHRPAGSCGYWSQRCSANWSRPSDYRGCMRYYGCL
jgi:hypothetical protein